MLCGATFEDEYAAPAGKDVFDAGVFLPEERFVFGASGRQKLSAQVTASVEIASFDFPLARGAKPRTL
jgi:hypothetical protein